MSEHTPGPWIVADSNSWRRIVTRDRGQHVIQPIKMRDGHPDLLAKPADLELAARAPELLAENERLTAEVTRLRSVVQEKNDALQQAWRELHAAKYLNSVSGTQNP